MSKIKLIRQLIFTALFCFYNSNPSYAQTSALRYFLLKPSAASMALGGSGVSYYNNAFSSYYNPALITETKSTALSYSYVNPLPFFDAIEHLYFGLSFKADETSFVSISGNFFKQPAQLATDPAGNTLGSDGTGNDNYQYMIKAFYALKVNKIISFGVGLGRYDILLNKSFIGNERSNGKTNGFTINLGVFFKNLLPDATIQLPDFELLPLLHNIVDFEQRKGLQIGFSFSNYGQDVFFMDEAQKDPLPTVLLAGISYWLISSNIISGMLTTEIENQIYDDPFVDYVRTGFKVELFQILQIYGGYVSGTNQSRKSFPSFGLGINTKLFILNISRYNSTFLPVWHYDATLRLEF